MRQKFIVLFFICLLLLCTSVDARRKKKTKKKRRTKTKKKVKKKHEGYKRTGSVKKRIKHGRSNGGRLTYNRYRNPNAAPKRPVAQNSRLERYRARLRAKGVHVPEAKEVTEEKKSKGKDF